MAACRFCHAPLIRRFVDLGSQPLANSYIPAARASEHEPRYPLHVYVCARCFLVQTDHDIAAESIFTNYAYFSSYTASWVEHARRYAETMAARFGLADHSQVIEVASNDGYLLQHFKAAGIDVLGVEPAANVAAIAMEKGIPSETAFFNRDTALRLQAAGRAADLMVANNVMAHVPDLNDFVAGFPILLKPQGVLTVEFHYLLNLLEQVQFDTIYHEHYSYLSLAVAERIFAAHGLRVFDAEERPTHGGSLRLFVCLKAAAHAEGEGLLRLRAREAAAGLSALATYDDFAVRVTVIRDEVVAFLQQAKRTGKTVAAYGAAAKGNTLLNFCGVTTAEVFAVYDKNSHKQNCLLPGSRIPVRNPACLAEDRPDYLLILPWNLASEISADQAQIRSWGGRFVTAIPRLRID